MTGHANRRRLLDDARHLGQRLARRVTAHDPFEIVYATEQAEWSVYWDGFYIARGVSALGLPCRTAFSTRFKMGGVLHFGCLSLALGHAARALDKDNRVLATLFHGDFGISSKMDRQLTDFLNIVPSLGRVIVSSGGMYERMISWGVPSESLARIALGFDRQLFTPAMKGEKARLRERLGIPEGAYCIGSFQKDGEGQGEGNIAKHIKGPDIFVDVVAELHRQFPIHCLLTGPARGFVVNELRQRGISHSHKPVSHYRDMADLYRCLDLYIVASREEGGPKALLEAPACGIPVVSTRVGMAMEIVAGGGLLADDARGLVAAATRILADPATAEAMAMAGPVSVQAYGWEQIARQYHALYSEFIPQ